MKLPYPINTTSKTTNKQLAHHFHSALAGGLLAFMACTTLAPNNQNRSANYIDARRHATTQDTGKSDQYDRWFY
jgi:hypothetical protein